MIPILMLQACAPAEQPFQFQMSSRGVYRVPVVDAVSGEPVQGAIVGLQSESRSSQFLVRAVVTGDGIATMRVSRPASDTEFSLVALHPDYTIERIDGEPVLAWLAGEQTLSFSMKPR